MILQCRYCEFQRTETLPESILTILADLTDGPEEDYMLWVERLVRTMDMSKYHAIKVHTGRMHKTEHSGLKDPLFIPYENEAKILNKVLQ